MRVTEDCRTPRADIVDVFVVVHVPHAGALGALREKRLPAHGAEGAHGRVHAAGNEPQRLGEECLGTRSRNHGGRIGVREGGGEESLARGGALKR